MDEQYRLVFRGEVLEGQHRAVVKRRLMESLKLNEAQADKLFSGRSVVLKREADSATAARYQALFKKAGGRLRLLPVADAADPLVGSVAEPVAESGESKPAEPESTLSLQAAYVNNPEAPEDSRSEIQAPDFGIAEIGADLVEPATAQQVTVPDVDFDLAEAGADILAERPAQAVAMVADVAFEVAEVGSDIGVWQDEPLPPPPDISHIELIES